MRSYPTMCYILKLPESESLISETLTVWLGIHSNKNDSTASDNAVVCI